MAIVSEMISDVYEQLGKPSDLDPYEADGVTVDIASSGAVTILRWLNRGYRRILTWRFPNGRIIKFKTTEKKLYFKTTVLTGTVAAGDAQTVTLDAGAAAVADRYVGWVVEVNGEKRKIMAYTAGRVATVNKAWSTAPAAADTWTMYKNFEKFVAAGSADADEHIVLNPVNDVMSVLRITDMDNGSLLQRADRITNLETSLITSGVPSVFQDREDGIFFDTAVNEERYYELRYHGFPAEMTTLTESPKVPPQFHEAILLWAVWWGLRRYQEFTGAYSTKRDLEDVMATALQQFDLSNDREEVNLYIGGSNYA